MSKQKINFTEPNRLGVPRGSTILVALSGGADSSALLHLLVEYAKGNGSKIVAAHVNHGIRGAEYGFEADRDEQFCRELCSSLSVELYIKKLDIPTLAKESGRSLESEAREARYSFFAEIMERENIEFLATAHNADDSIETQLFNFCRGCGIDGMVGIPESRSLSKSEKKVVRPLLKAEKSEIIAYCKENEIDFVTDSTNLENDCTRNQIRHNIIPVLDEIFPAAKKNAQRLAQSAREDSDFIFQEASRFLESNQTLEIQKLRELHPALLKRVLLIAFAETSDATLEAVHLEALTSLLSNQKNGARISLPDKRQATLIDGILVFSNDERDIIKDKKQYSQGLSLGMNIIEDTDFAVFLSHYGGEKPNLGKEYTLYSSADLFLNSHDALRAKNRGQGDTVLDCNINKKIKKLMCDKKVPLPDRDTLPLICNENDVIYVPLCAVSDNARAVRDKKPNYTVSILKNTWRQDDD